MMASMPVQVGDVVEGKYRVERVLGQGGMGLVVAAWHLQLDEMVALKFLLPEAQASEDIVARFQTEARAAAKIKSEHVCRVLDVGVSATHGPYMVMEHMTGEDLGSLVDRIGPLPIRQAAGCILEASVALAEAHARGIVHRDLKPSNLFLAERSDGGHTVKVLDFGISKMASKESETSRRATATSVVMGSCAYMSPEQARSTRNVDARCDIWALGVILHELLTGSVPFEAENPSAYIAMIAADPPVPLRQKMPDAPPELEAVILRCLEKDRNKRYATVGELARALAPFVPGTKRLVEKIVRLCNAPPPAPSFSGVTAASTASPSAAAGASEPLVPPAKPVSSHRAELSASPVSGVEATAASAMVPVGPKTNLAERTAPFQRTPEPGALAPAPSPPAALPSAQPVGRGGSTASTWSPAAEPIARKPSRAPLVAVASVVGLLAIATTIVWATRGAGNTAPGATASGSSETTVASAGQPSGPPSAESSVPGASSATAGPAATAAVAPSSSASPGRTAGAAATARASTTAARPASSGTAASKSHPKGDPFASQ
jgi:eukaryotic-like serine/threonine-protein kinase